MVEDWIGGMMEVWKNEIIEAGINGIMEIQFAYMEGWLMVLWICGKTRGFDDMTKIT